MTFLCGTTLMVSNCSISLPLAYENATRTQRFDQRLVMSDHDDEQPASRAPAISLTISVHVVKS